MEQENGKNSEGAGETIKKGAGRMIKIKKGAGRQEPHLPLGRFRYWGTGGVRPKCD